MSETPSTMRALGSRAPDFSLSDPFGKKYSSHDFDKAPALLVVFMCNHCPYVMHVREVLISLIEEYRTKGLAAVGINANDATAYLEDGPEYMKKDILKYKYPFPYLFDETQETAKAYHAACTPDFFLFNSRRELVYRGQLDDSRPGNHIPVTGADLRKALDAVLSGKPVLPEQKPSRGCNIKWKPGNEPSYYTVHQSGF